LDGTHLIAQLRLQFSDTMFDALEHGVPLTLNFRIQRAHLIERRALQLRYAALTDAFEIRTFELGKIETKAVLNSLNSVRSFSSRAQLEAALDQVDFTLLPDSASDCVLELHLDTASLPAPLRLPALLESQWRGLRSEYRWPCAL
jgi:Domain of unknown function (DUF4390)